MNSKIISIASFLAIFGLVVGAISCFGIAGSNLQIINGSVEDSVKLFWEFSLKADAEKISQISELPPDRFLLPCEVVNKESSATGIEPIVVEKEPRMQASTDSNNGQNTGAAVKGNDFSDRLAAFKNTVPIEISSTASYIYGTAIKFSRVRIESREVYQDEAVVSLKIADYTGKFHESDENNLVFFLKRHQDNWKIISILDKNTLPDGILFAKPRPACQSQ